MLRLSNSNATRIMPHLSYRKTVNNEMTLSSNARSYFSVYTSCQGILLSMCNSQFGLSMPLLYVLSQKEKTNIVLHYKMANSWEIKARKYNDRKTFICQRAQLLNTSYFGAHQKINSMLVSLSLHVDANEDGVVSILGFLIYQTIWHLS